MVLKTLLTSINCDKLLIVSGREALYIFFRKSDKVTTGDEILYPLCFITLNLKSSDSTGTFNNEAIWENECSVEFNRSNNLHQK